MLRRRDAKRVLRVRVGGELLGSDDPLAIDAGDRVASAPTEADDLDVRPHLAEHLFELGVHPAVLKRWSTPFPGEHILKHRIHFVTCRTREVIPSRKMCAYPADAI